MIVSSVINYDMCRVVLHCTGQQLIIRWTFVLYYWTEELMLVSVTI